MTEIADIERTAGRERKKQRADIIARVICAALVLLVSTLFWWEAAK